MKKTVIEAHVKDLEWNEGRIEWPAYETGVPGLVVHRVIAAAKGDGAKHVDEMAFVPGDTWVVAHVESGQTVDIHNVKIETRALALKVAEALAPFADWTRPREELKRAHINLSLVYRAMKEVLTKEAK